MADPVPSIQRATARPVEANNELVPPPASSDHERDEQSVTSTPRYTTKEKGKSKAKPTDASGPIEEEDSNPDSSEDEADPDVGNRTRTLKRKVVLSSSDNDTHATNQQPSTQVTLSKRLARLEKDSPPGSEVPLVSDLANGTPTHSDKRRLPDDSDESSPSTEIRNSDETPDTANKAPSSPNRPSKDPGTIPAVLRDEGIASDRLV